MVCHFVTILNMGLSTSDKSKMVFEHFLCANKKKIKKMGKCYFKRK